MLFRAAALLFVILLAPQPARAQFDCGTDELHRRALVSDPAYRRAFPSADQPRRRRPAKANLPYVLPVVFHLVHDNGPENLSDEQITQALSWTNQALAQEGPFARGTTVDTDIRLCLARRTPDNEAATGINRVVSPLTDEGASFRDREVKDLSRWDPTQYLNVWIVREIVHPQGRGVAGYAYYPSAHGRPFDGVVMEARWLRTEGGAAILAHEIGHYLGLFHTFEGGCRNDDCTRDGDRVCDTPPDASRAGVPCNETTNSCTTDAQSGFSSDQPDPTSNFMDYGRLDCKYDFTPGQRDRMLATLESTRRSLLRSPGCFAPCPTPVTARQTGGDTTIAPGTMLTLRGVATNADRLSWEVDGAGVATGPVLNYLFPGEGRYEVTLVARSSDARCAPAFVSVVVTVRCPITVSIDAPPARVYAGTRTELRASATAATRYRWTVDGTPAGAASRRLQYNFRSPGSYEVCVTAAGANCERTSCRFLRVRERPCPECGVDGECADAFQLAFRDEINDNLPLRTDHFTVADNRIYATGTNELGDYFFATGPDGTVHWQHGTRRAEGTLHFAGQPFIVDERHVYYQLLVTALNSGRRSLRLFKIRRGDGAVRWAREYTGADGLETLNQVVSLAPGADGSLVAVADAQGSTPTSRLPLVLVLDAATGDVRRSTHLKPRMTQFRHAYAVDRATGSTYFFTSPLGAFASMPRLYLGQIDRRGELAWLRAYRGAGLAQNTFGSLILRGDSLLIVGEAVLAGNAARGPGELRVSFDRSGRPGRTELLFHTAPADAPPRTERLLANEAGYLALLRNRIGRNSLQVQQFGTTGRQLFTRGLRLGVPEDGSAPALLNGQLILSAETSATGQAPRSVLVGLDREFTGGDCVGRSQQTTPVTLRPARLEEVPVTGSATSVTVTAGPARLTLESHLYADPATSCLPACPPPEVCDDGIDNDEDGLVDCDDPNLATDCCCRPARRLALNQTDTVACPGDTLRLAPLAPFPHYRWSTGDTTEQLAVTTSGTYALTVTDGCGNVSADTVRVDFRRLPSLDLGPDTTVCQNETVTFAADSGFVTYAWNVIPAEGRRFTADRPGTFRVTATDACGNVATDSVTLRWEAGTVIDLGGDKSVCAGESVTLTVTGDFSDIRWSENGAPLGCADCRTITHRAARTTLLGVTATSATGCTSSDEVLVSVGECGRGSRRAVALCAGDSVRFGERIIRAMGRYFRPVDGAPPGTQDTLDVRLRDTVVTRLAERICPGDTVAFAGRLLSEPGTYRDSLRTAAGCDSTVILELSPAPGVATSERRFLCPGDTIRLGERRVTEPGEYVTVHRSAAGCDSTVTTTVTGDGGHQTILERTLCAGDTLLLIGQTITAPGTYEADLLSVGGCDSTVRVVVTASDLSVTATALAPDCGGGAGAGAVLTVGGRGPVTLQWPDGSAAARRSDLAQSNYLITATDSSGCSDTTTLTITAGGRPALRLSGGSEGCDPAAAAGFLLVEGETAGLSFQLNDGAPQPSPRFPNLAPGPYRILASGAGNCPRQLDTTLSPAAAPQLDSLPLRVVQLGDSLDLTVSGRIPAGSTVRWRTAAGDSLGGGSPLRWLAAQTTEVVATVTSPDGCLARARGRVIVEYNDNLFVPNAFSPNGDGTNDRLEVFPGPAVRRVLSLTVYSPWHGEVYREVAPAGAPQSFRPAWDGNDAAGRPYGIGVYAYVVEYELVDGRRIVRNGDVLIMR